MIKTKEYGLVLLDVMMPNVSRLEVCRALKRDQGTRCIPVVMFSALGTGTRMMLEKADQADAYLQKPFTVTGFKEIVDKVLRAQRV